MNYLPLFSPETWILLITFICLFVMYGKATHGIFEKLGIPGTKPVMYFGTVSKHNRVYYLADHECAQKYGNVWGMYEFRKPILAVKDPDMLKTILVKECFTHFTNRRNFRLIGDMYDAVNFAEDNDWRRLRNNVSPFFTTGHIKQFFALMKHQSSKLMSSLEPKAQNEEVISVKDFFNPYSINIFTGCTLGLEMESSLLVKYPSNPFKVSIPLFLLQACFPVLLPLLERLDVSLFPRDAFKFVEKIVEKMRADRDGSSHQELDFLQYLTNTQTKEDKKGLTDHEIVTQMMGLLTASHEAITLILELSVYCLARNPESLMRLQEEIDSTFPDEAAVTYEALTEMEFLDCVINECLRVYPSVPRLERVAKKTVKINGITIPKDMTVMVPVYALHHDPQHWPQPEEFRPDRFSRQNKGRINPYTYLPFGIGPRNCVGMRLALVMVKLALVEVLQKYSFLVCEETEIPFEMDPTFTVGPINPIKLRVVRR